MSCSNRKTRQPGPAWQVYDGPAYRVLRASGFPARCVGGMYVAILSAEHGLIPAAQHIAPYDRRMDRSRGAALASVDRTTLDRAVERITGGAALTQVLFYGGTLYRDVMQTWSGAGLFGAAPLLATRGGIGAQLGQLKRWLRDPPGDIATPDHATGNTGTGRPGRANTPISPSTCRARPVVG